MATGEAVLGLVLVDEHERLLHIALDEPLRLRPRLHDQVGHDQDVVADAEHREGLADVASQRAGVGGPEGHDPRVLGVELLHLACAAPA